MRDLFGLPSSLPVATAEAISAYLRTVWLAAYGAEVGDLRADLERCGRYFNPLLRGQTLRSRLTDLAATPAPPAVVDASLADSVLIPVDTRHRLIGVEGRLVLEALARGARGTSITVEDELVIDLLDEAATTYRAWTLQRLGQVIALRTGRGKEYLQPKAVGLVLGLLVNRSTSRERGVISAPVEEEIRGAERAVFDGAEAFAGQLGTRNDRSKSEDRLRGGYAVTEARRRISELLIDQDPGGAAAYFLKTGSLERVVESLAGELSRRPRLREEELGAAFDALVEAYRDRARTDSWLGGFHERGAETTHLREELLTAFASHRMMDQGDGA